MLLDNIDLQDTSAIASIYDFRDTTYVRFRLLNYRQSPGFVPAIPGYRVMATTTPDFSSQQIPLVSFMNTLDVDVIGGIVLDLSNSPYQGVLI